MRIAYLSNSRIPSTAANSVHVMKMCAALVRQGHSVDLYAAKAEKYCTGDLYEYYGVDNTFSIILSEKPLIRGGSMIYSIICNIKLLFRKYDLFYARNLPQARSILLKGVPLIIEVHDIPSNEKSVNIIRKIINHKCFVKIVSISNALKYDYLRIFPELDESQIIVAHDCADNPLVKPRERSKEIAVGYVGHLYEGRGLNLITQISRNLKSIKFYIVGGTPEAVEIAKKSHALENIIFEGYVPNGDIERYYAKFDIALAPYQKKVTVAGGGGDTSKYMSPLKIFEYMAYRKAIVCSDLPVLREVLKDQYNCLLCEYNNVDEWTQAILKLIEDSKLRNRLINTAYSDFSKNYTWDSRVKAIIGD